MLRVYRRGLYVMAGLALTLAACGEDTRTGIVTIDLASPKTQEAALQMIAAYNEAGIDPIKMPEEDLAKLRVACFSTAILSEIVNLPDDTPITKAMDPETLIGLCRLIAAAAE